MKLEQAVELVLAPAIALALALALSACGSDGADGGSNRPAANTVRAEESASVPSDPDADHGVTTLPPDSEVFEANGEVVDVVALDNTFRPEQVEIVAGTEIRWENRGRNDHDVVPGGDVLDWGVDIAGFAPGDDYSRLFDTPGEYRYFCSIHGTEDVGMIGTIVVVAPVA